MAYDFFDEGISNGGVRSKTEIRTLICYMFVTIDKPMTKDLVLNSLLDKGLANYFEISSAFDDLVKDKHLVLSEGSSTEYTYTDNTVLISNSLESALPITLRERACECALNLIEKTRKEKYNHTKIEKDPNGFKINCSISSEEMDLMSVNIFCPKHDQARLLRKNFQKDPEIIYQAMIALLTRDKNEIKNILELISKIS